MKAEIINLTPQKAKELLGRNIQNRPLRDVNISEYAHSMRSGEWKENGQGIIIDVKGVIKNGQHRMYAVIEADYSYETPLITGVEEDVMATIDIGKIRTLGDVLHLNGIKNATQIAALTAKILTYKRGALKKGNLSGVRRITNTQGIVYVKKHERELQEINRLAVEIYLKQPTKAFYASQIGKYLYMLKGFGISESVTEFMEQLCGVNSKHGNSANYVYKQVLTSKRTKSKLSPRWVDGVIIKAWNNFVSGDPQVVSLRYDITNPLPKIR